MKAMKAMKQGPKTVEEQFQKLSLHEHVLKRPDSYIGTVEPDEGEYWVLNADSLKMERRKLRFVPGLFKIFDEILVNAADNYQRDPSMSSIKINVDVKTNTISVENDGKGIPIEMVGGLAKGNYWSVAMSRRLSSSSRVEEAMVGPISSCRGGWSDLVVSRRLVLSRRVEEVGPRRVEVSGIRTIFLALSSPSSLHPVWRCGQRPRAHADLRLSVGGGQF